MLEPKKNNQLSNIIADLTSKENKKILFALEQLRKHGKKEAFLPLIDTLITTTNDEIKQEIINLLYDLRDQTIVETIISAINNKKYTSIKPILISIFWQSSLDVSQYISTFIKQAIKGDYLVGIEVLSVIENFNSTFAEDEINDLKFDLEEAIEIEKTEKVNLLISIKAILGSLNIEY